MDIVKRHKWIQLFFVVSLTGSTQVLAGTSSRTELNNQRYCGIVNQCDVHNGPALCEDLRWRSGVSKIKYDQPRCQAPQELARLGVESTSSDGRILYKYLGNEHQVVYDVAGQARFPAAQMAFLLEELPLATKLLNEYTGGDFEARFSQLSGSNWIYGSKGEHFSGRAKMVAGDVRRGKAYYLGYGKAEILNLGFHGKVVLDIDFRNSKKGNDWLDYQVTLYSASNNETIYSMMDSHVFHYFADKLVSSIISDLARAAKTATVESAEGTLAESEWTKEEQQKISFLARLK